MTNTNGTSSCYKSDNMYSVTQKQKLGRFCENYQVHLQYVFNQNRKLKILIRHIDFKELCLQQNFSTSSPNSTFFSCFTFTLMQGIIVKQIYSVAFEPERKLMYFPVHLAFIESSKPIYIVSCILCQLQNEEICFVIHSLNQE